MTNIRRYDPGNAPVFITAVSHNHLPLLRLDENKVLLLSVIREVKAETNFQMLAYVILDDHFHWLIQMANGDFSKIMQSVKLRFTRRLKRSEGNGDHCWQQRFWDHIIRDGTDLQRHLDYIHFNPVKHGYVRSPVDYRFSSYSAYLAKGVYSPDWGTGTEPESLREMILE
jgi:putative transposase